MRSSQHAPEFVARILRIGGRALVVLAVLCGLLAVRVVMASRAELREAEQHRAAEEIERAIVHYRRAARWYAPLSPYPRQALQALSEIAVAAEQRGDTQRALLAYRAIRSAILATRSFYLPSASQLEAANQKIAERMASLPPPPMDAEKDAQQRRAEHLALLAEIPDPHWFWTWVMLAGFGAWLTGGLCFVARGIDAEQRVRVPEARRWGALTLAGCGMVVVGLLLA